MTTPLDDKMPEKLKRLPEIAYNLWWSWNPEARALFKQLDMIGWRATQHNPVQMLREMSYEQLEEAAKDSNFYRQYNKVLLKFDHEMANGHTWFHQTYPEHKEKTIAYFSFEFGLHNSLPIYSGGLGILSGDHAKEASDLGLPFVGVGFMYPQGYFRQRIPSHGWQEAVYQQLNMAEAPIMLARNSEGNEIRIHVRFGGRTVHARVWQARVGRISLYLGSGTVRPALLRRQRAAYSPGNCAGYWRCARAAGIGD
jgi:glycogen phosphorylase